MNKHKLETVVFLSGALVMILELTGSRVLSPYFGNSIYIWTGMIGVILGFLSLGYYYGGIIADKDSSLPRLSQMLWLAGLSTFFLATFKEPVLQFFATLTSGDIRTGSLYSIIFLFGGVGTLLGTITPMVVKLKLDSLSKVGTDVGKIYALSTLGSITGTFLSGYFLIPLIGNTNLIYLVAVFLLGLSFWVSPTLGAGKILAIIFLFLLYCLRTYNGLFQISAIADIDTIYNRILIRDGVLNGKTARMFMTDRLGIQSAIYLDNKQELASEYTRSFSQIASLLPRSTNSLVIGGAGLAFPSHFMNSNMGEKMAVVEIDPEMINIAKKYFFFKEIDNLNVYADDARNYIQKTTNKYDLVFLDAFNSLAPPPHLTTNSFFGLLSRKMTSDGVLIANLITSITGKNSGLLTWQYSTLKKIFKEVEVYKIVNDRPDNQIQNVIIITYKDPNTKIDTSKLPKNISLVDTSNLYSNKKILTNDYAPVEHLAAGFMGGSW